MFSNTYGYRFVVMMIQQINTPAESPRVLYNIHTRILRCIILKNFWPSYAKKCVFQFVISPGAAAAPCLHVRYGTSK